MSLAEWLADQGPVRLYTCTACGKKDICGSKTRTLCSPCEEAIEDLVRNEKREEW